MAYGTDVTIKQLRDFEEPRISNSVWVKVKQCGNQLVL